MFISSSFPASQGVVVQLRELRARPDLNGKADARPRPPGERHFPLEIMDFPLRIRDFPLRMRDFLRTPAPSSQLSL